MTIYANMHLMTFSSYPVSIPRSQTQNQTRQSNSILQVKRHRLRHSLKNIGSILESFNLNSKKLMLLLFPGKSIKKADAKTGREKIFVGEHFANRKLLNEK